MKRRDFMLATGAFLAQSALGVSDMIEKRPNILFVFADQLRTMEIGCYGGSQVPTPNMDRLAREGVRFTHAFSTYPVCSPYRAMLMTGNYPMKNGMLMNDHFLSNPTPYFAEVCKAAGYNTGYIGKWHIDGRGRQTYIPPERRRGFDYWRTLECTHEYFDSKYYHQNEKAVRVWPGYDSISQTESAQAFIESQKNGHDPFCLFLSWGPPHDPYTAPEEYMARFQPDELTLRENVNDFAAAEKMWQETNTKLLPEHDAIRKSFHPFLNDRENRRIRQWYQGYLAAISVLDDCLGRLLDTLDRNGMAENTIVVFTSDHGDNLASHRQYGKLLPYEESIAVPFIMRYPKKIPQGTISECLLSPVDIMPTLLGLAGLHCPKVDGMDLSQAAVGEGEEMQEAVLLMRLVWLCTNWITNASGPWRGVRTKRWTYARKSDTREPWMLFDNDTDPQQMHNLVSDPDYAHILRRLDKKTDELLLRAGDPEDPIEIATRIKREREQMDMPMSDGVLFPEAK